MEPKMRYGTINCTCGKSFYFETVRREIHCINCDKKHDITSYPIKEEPIIDELEEPKVEEGE